MPFKFQGDRKTRNIHLAVLTHWGRVTHICLSKLTSIGSDNSGRRQAIIWTNAEILLIGPLETNFSENLIAIHTFSFKKMSSGKWCPFCLGLNVLRLVRYTNKMSHWVKHELAIIFFFTMSKLKSLTVAYKCSISHTYALYIAPGPGSWPCRPESHTRPRRSAALDWRACCCTSSWDPPEEICHKVPSNLWYKVHQIPKLECFSHLAVVFTQSIEARC